MKHQWGTVIYENSGLNPHTGWFEVNIDGIAYIFHIRHSWKCIKCGSVKSKWQHTDYKKPTIVTYSYKPREFTKEYINCEDINIRNMLI